MASFSKVVAFAVLGITWACANEPTLQLRPENVSMVQLIAFPDRYVGKVISVSGFVTEDGDRLFLTKDHYQLTDAASMIFVDIAYKKQDNASDSTRLATGCENNYARLDGTFSDIGDGTYGLWYVFKIAKPRGLPAPGPPRIGCWRNSAKDPFLENRERYFREKSER